LPFLFQADENQLFGWIADADFAKARLQPSVDGIAEFGDAASNTFFASHGA
jgi:hypothetical protein